MKYVRCSLSNSLLLTRLLVSSVMACSTMFIGGCGVAPSSNNAATTPTAESSSNSQPASSDSAVASTSGEKASESELDSTTAAEATSIPQEVNPDDASTTSPTDVATASPATPTPTVDAQTQLQKPIVTLTEEQQQQWTVSKHEGFKLLAYAERPSRLTLVTCSEPIPSSDSYLAGGTVFSLWSPAAAEPKWSVLIDDQSGDPNFVTCISCSPDGQYAAFGDSNGTVRVCNTSDGNVTVEKKLHPSKVFSIAFSPDGKSIASTGSDSKATISAAENLQPTGTMTFDTSGVQRIAFLGNDSIIAMGEKAAVYNISDSKAVATLPTPRFGFGLSTRSSSALLATEDRMLQIAPGQTEPETIVDGKFARDEGAAISADGKLLATVNGNAIRLWDMSSKRCVQWIDVAGDTVVGLFWSPNANLLTSVHAMGPTRVWGTEATASTSKLSVVHSDLQTETDSKTKVPTAAAWLATIDLRAFPLPKSSMLQITEPTTFSFLAPLSPDDAKSYARYQLGELGWLEEPTPNNPYTINFHKDGLVLASSFYEAQPGQSSVNMNLSGLDLRTLPRLSGEGVTEVFADRNTVLMQSKADITAIEIEILRKFREFGGVPFVSLNTSRSSTPDQRTLTFLLGPVQLNVMISRTPTATDSFTVSYAAFPALTALPVPSDVDYLEFTGVPVPVVVFASQANIAELVTFYDRAMAEAGWLALKEGRYSKDQRSSASYLRDGRDVSLQFNRLESGQTLVTAGEVSKNSSYTLSLLLKSEETSSEPVESSEGDILEAADFPIPPAAANKNLDRVAQIIEFEVPSMTLTKLSEAFTVQLEKLGWKAEAGGVRGDDYTFFEFAKGDLSIEFRATYRNGTASVNIQGDGLGWTKEIAGASKIMSYEQWLIDHRKPLSLSELDAFAAEMSK